MRGLGAEKLWQWSLVHWHTSGMGTAPPASRALRQGGTLWVASDGSSPNALVWAACLLLTRIAQMLKAKVRQKFAGAVSHWQTEKPRFQGLSSSGGRI